MLKKPSVILSSYHNAHCLYSSQPYSLNNPASPRNPSERTLSRRRDPWWKSYPSAHSTISYHDQQKNPPWPNLSSSLQGLTPYQIFDIEKGAPYSKQRFYQLVKIYHPDRNIHGNRHHDIRSLSGAVKMERYRLVVAAHEILSDPEKRAAYDASGAGWNGRPEHRAPRYHWASKDNNPWSGFDKNDSSFSNATWEDWEKWYQRDKVKQAPVYFSNGGFLVLVITVLFLGGFGQSIRIGDYSDTFKRQVEIAHDDASKALRQRKTESVGFGNKDERLQNFLKSRGPQGYGITDPVEEEYRKLLPAPETCMSDGIHQQGHAQLSGLRH